MNFKIILGILLVSALLLTGCSTTEIEQVDLTNVSIKLDSIQKDISNFKPAVCPSLSCPKYEEVVCAAVVLDADNILLIDKFQFRYNVIEENYELIKDKVEDDNDKVYCKEEIIDLRKDLDISLSYIQEFILKSKFPAEHPNTYSYKIFTEGYDYFKEYLNDVELYCKGTKDTIVDTNYDMYKTYITYYNNISVSSDLRHMEILREIKE